MGMTEAERLSLKDSIEKCIETKTPFVFYRLPNETKVNFISGLLEENRALNQEKSGFLFSPFITSTEFPSYFIKSDKHFKLDITDLEGLRIQTNKLGLKSSDNIQANKQEHSSKVASAVADIKEGKLDKVIVSRLEHVDFDAELVYVFSSLCKKYESVFVSLVVIPGKTVWLTASPELLVSAEGKNIKTVSLAGTKPANENIAWTEKEKKEQQLVTDYISDIVKETCKNVNVSGPKDVMAGNVVHLKSEFSAILTTDLKELITKLHPTPAICGMPKDKAIDFILANETHKRKYYTGYLGPYNMNGKTELFVNLRCAEIFNTTADLFVGGGITEGSDPEKEWDETVLKSKTLLSVMLHRKEIV